MKEIIERGAASQIVHVFLPDSSSTTGAGKTGLTSASAGLQVSVIRPGEAAATVYTVAAGNVETITTIGTYQTPTASKCRFKEIDATNLPGWYEIHFADALFDATSSRRSLGGMIFGATNLAPTPFQVQLADPTRGVASPTALPNAAAGANSGLLTCTTGNVLPSGAIAAASFVAGAIDATAIAADAIGSSELAASAVTEIQAGLSTLDAAGIRTAVGLAAANLDTQLATIDDFLDTEIAAILAAVDTEVAAIKAKTDLIPAAPAAVGDIPTAAQNATQLLDVAAGVETNRTVRQALRLMLAALVGKLSGAATTTVAIRDTNDTVNRVSATVDADGNRSAVTLDAT